jgi:hypothetical protein
MAQMNTEKDENSNVYFFNRRNGENNGEMGIPS